MIISHICLDDDLCVSCLWVVLKTCSQPANGLFQTSSVLPHSSRTSFIETVRIYFASSWAKLTPVNSSTVLLLPDVWVERSFCNACPTSLTPLRYRRLRRKRSCPTDASSKLTILKFCVYWPNICVARPLRLIIHISRQPLLRTYCPNRAKHPIGCTISLGFTHRLA